MNNIHYYPYASFKNEQLPLLKAAALYFDRLNILNPFEASCESIGAENANKGVSFLKSTITASLDNGLHYFLNLK